MGRFTRRFLVLLSPIIGLLLWLPGAASAQTIHPQPISSKVTLNGIMPTVRYIYVNPDGFITKIVGNTSDNITPSVASLDSKLLPMTDSIWQQYNTFMDQHSWQLVAGQTYDVSPPQVELTSVIQNPILKTQTAPKQISLQLQLDSKLVSDQSG